MSAPEVVLHQLTRRFRGAGARPDSVAVAGISLEIARGEVLALIGPSGCGKSTTLRMVAGLDEPDSGTLTIAGRAMRGVAPQDRDVAMVFQGYALYPHMTARRIIEFPLRMRAVPAVERARAVSEAAAMLGLERLLDRRPDQLSGGERQRVAMARAIVRKPRVFLFDEPLSNIDPALREDIRGEIGALIRRLGATALYVTHDHVEAMTLADRIAVMRAGRVLQCGTPKEIYQHPATEFVGTFVGSPRMNVLDAVVNDDLIVAGSFRWSRPAGVSAGPVKVGIRAEDFVLADAGARGDVVAVEPHGAESLLRVRVGELELRVREPGFRAPGAASEVHLSVRPGGAHFFAADELGTRLANP